MSVQKSDETVGQFIAELRKLSEHCELGENSQNTVS